MRMIISALLGVALPFVLAGSAQALNDRTWVSGAGTDAAGCGPIANPCRTLQYAYNSTNAGGEIDVKDSAGYGALDITGAISIIGDGSLAGVLAPATGYGIRITAGSSDKVVLRGLIIEGAGTAFNGIIFRSGGSLDIANCIVQNFTSNGGTTGTGVLLEPTFGTSTISIVNTTVLNNGLHGVHFTTSSASVSAQIVLDRVTAIRNFIGIKIDAYATSGTTRMAITNALVANSTSDGINLGSYTNASLNASIDLTVVEQNGHDGILVNSGSVRVGRSVSVNNGAYGLDFSPSAALSSYKDNRFDGNANGATSGTVATAPLN